MQYLENNLLRLEFLCLERCHCRANYRGVLLKKLYYIKKNLFSLKNPFLRDEINGKVFDFYCCKLRKT